jgi:hypothetical protein
MTDAAPEQQIRRYLEEQGGKSEASVEHLLVSFGFGEGDERDRAAIVDALTSAGVRVDRPLGGLRRDEPVTLSLITPLAGPVPPWSEEATKVVPPGEGTHDSRRGVRRFALIALVVLAAGGAAAGGYVMAEAAGVDLSRAHAEGVREGERLAAARVDRGAIRSARRTGRRASYQRAYRKSFAQAKERVLAAAPQACGDVRTSETPSLAKVRAQGVSCDSARNFVSGALDCGDLAGECQGYTCEAVSIAWEASEITCTSGQARIRFVTGV